MGDRQREADGFLPAVEVWRGGWIESIHRAAFVAVDSEGVPVAALGDSGRPVLWRSTAKPFQAAPLVESGARTRFGVSDAELAIACASHGGERFHLEAAASLLARGGLDENALLCGPHAPLHAASARRLVEEGREPTALHNNCSGKHAGMLLTTRHLGAHTGAYLEPDSPVQQAIRRALARHAAVDESRIGLAIDGCSAPTFALPLSALARAYARLATALEEPAADPALGAVARAMVGHPELVAGTGRLDTLLMRACPGRLIAKVGVEGMYAVAAVGPRGPLGLAVKIADGDGERAPSALVIALLARLGVLGADAVQKLDTAFPRVVRNRRQLEVGEVRVCAAALDAERVWK